MLSVLLVLAAPLHAQDLQFGYTPAPGPGEKPALLLTPTRQVANLFVSCDAGGKVYEFNKTNLAAGKQVRLEWARDPKVNHADCFVRASFADGNVTETEVPFDYTYKGNLSVDLSKASADIAAKTVTVNTSAPVNQAEIIAYGAHKAVIDQRTVPVGGGPGAVTVPFVGDPADVVLLDVTLRNETAYAGFTYSPWFLDIPHEDVLFPSDSAEILPDQAYKLEATLSQLNDVIDKYGAVVPVKLYIAGCTDTVGDSAHNKDLSLRRAQAIARWLRGHGYDKPIFYWGFGESLLAVQTGDNVDMQVNRRALYMVGANPPPAGSGIPGITWKPL